MSRLNPFDDYALREYPGRSSGDNSSFSGRSVRLIDGIRADDEFFRSIHYHMSLLDFGMDNVCRVPEGNDSLNKYQKILAREKLLFQALFRRACRKARDPDFNGMIMPPAAGNVKPTAEAYNSLSKIVPSGRETYRGYLSRLLVVKIVSSTKQSFETEFLHVINQLKVLNESYSTQIPLILVSNYYNNEYVKKVAEKYCQENLNIQVIKQPLFPLVRRLTHDPSKSDFKKADDSSAAPQPVECFYSITSMETKREDISNLLPHQVTRLDWYNPGEVFTLCEQVKNHIIANDKDYILFLNGSDIENVVDLRILNYLFEPRTGQRIDVCFEVIKPRESDLSNGCDFLIQSGDTVRVLSKHELENSGYAITADSLVLTQNMWINLPFLRTEESDTILSKIVLAKELNIDDKVTHIRLEMTAARLIEAQGAFCTAVQVPALRVTAGGPLGWIWDKHNLTCIQKVKLKDCLTYTFWAFCYHTLIYVMTASLNQSYVKRGNLEMEKDAGRELRELNAFWIENGVWLVVVIFYFLFLTSKRLKMAKKGRSPQQRERAARADFAQALLLGTTRFLYAGLNRTAEVKRWFGGDAWYYLLLLHFLSGVLEIAGSILIMFLIDPPDVMEPLETA